MQTKTVNPTPRKAAEQRYAIARSNLILMLALTVINIILFLIGSNTMMLFSATIPYFAVIFGSVSESGVFLAICIGIAAVTIIAYLLCWIFSKKQYGWMIAALVLFVIDTLAMAGMYLLIGETSGILDVLIHVWVLYYLITGVYYGSVLKKLPADEPIAVEAQEAETEDAPATVEDTRALRMADTEVKARTLLEADALGRHIVYRRVKRVNELVINGYVYDEVEMLVETAHALTANLDGHTFVVGHDGHMYSYLEVDGALVQRKARLW